MISLKNTAVLLSFTLLAATCTTVLTAMNVVTESKQAAQDELNKQLINAICTDEDNVAANELLVAGASPDAVDSIGVPILHKAAIFGPTACLDTLIRAGANINITDWYFGQTALHLTAKFGLLDCSMHLVEAGATIDARDCRGLTPCQYAVVKGNLNIIEYLLEIGASPALIGPDGKSIITINGEPLKDDLTNEPIEITSEKVKAAIQKGIKKHRARPNRIRTSILLAAMRANSKNAIKNSIFDAITEINQYADTGITEENRKRSILGIKNN